MNGAFRRTKMKDWYEFSRQTCPICHKTGGCIIHEDGSKVACIRESSDIQFGKGSLVSWLHYIEDGVKVDKASVESEGHRTRSKLPAHILNHIFSELMVHPETELSEDHMNHLLHERKLSYTTLNTRGYVSFPEKPWVVAKDILPQSLMARLDQPNFTMGIPGFFKNKYGWSITGSRGIFIPYRDENNWITGFQIRVDNPKNDVEIDATNFDGLYARVKEQPDLVQVLNDGEVVLERRFELNEVETITVGNKVGTVKLKKGQRYYWFSSANKDCGTGAGDPVPIHVAVPTKQLIEWNKAVENDKEKDTISTTLKVNAIWITEGACETCSPISLAA